MRTAACILLACLLGFSPGVRADVPPGQRAEVEHLIGYLENSDCEMLRNGRIHDGPEGARHVRRKYDHFRDEISSTEDFIELAELRIDLLDYMVSKYEAEAYADS